MTRIFSAWLHNGRRNRASSLMEVLIVLLILVVIISVFSLASHELIVRAKVSKTKDDHRLLAHALESYLMDHQDVPSNYQGLSPLADTRKYPVLPQDPFSTQGDNYVFIRNPLAEDIEDSYASLGEVRFVIAGVGPNGKSEVLEHLFAPDEEEIDNDGEPEVGQKSLVGSAADQKLNILTLLDLEVFLKYDPTNGANSAGDIIRIQR